MPQASRTVRARIHRLSGQLQAIETMIKQKRPCADILWQISAVRAGLENVALLVLQRELRRPGLRKAVSSKDLQKLLRSFIQST